MSCFAAGTPVWTETGSVPIESIRRGDKVLSQQTQSGELKYQIVLDTTLRSPSPTLQIRVGEDQIVTTLGHPFWVTGAGWRMAKELKVGDRLHGVEGSVMVDQIETGETLPAHNLVVAETNTYCVGENRLLVHDNTPRDSMVLPIPGWQTNSNRPGGSVLVKNQL